MAGYNEFSKSNNACEAEAAGRYPASKVAAMCRVPIEFVRDCGTREWHHSSKHYNTVDYYDAEAVREILNTPEGQERLARIKVELATKAASPVKVFNNCRVTWLEWGGTRRHPRATEHAEDNCTVTDRGGKFVEVMFNGPTNMGQTMRKGKDTRGFSFKEIK